MKLWILFCLLPFAALAEEKDKATACADALNQAQSKVKSYIESLSYNTTSQGHAENADGQVYSTGNPITDMATQMNQNMQKMMELKQQQSQAMAQAEDNCFQQSLTLDDQDHQDRQKGYELQRKINTAETEKLKQEAQIRINCHAEAAKLATAEKERLARYDQRTVSTVGGATQSKQQINGLHDRFYNECLSSGATKEALNSCKLDLDTNMRNLASLNQEVLSDIDYRDSKRGKMNAHCNLQYERVDKQFGDQMRTLTQSQLISGIGLAMAMKTAAANGSAQNSAYQTYSTLQDLLEPSKWEELMSNCTNAANYGATHATAVPNDVVDAFNTANSVCRPEGAESTRKCVVPSGANSQEKQRQQSGNSTATGV